MATSARRPFRSLPAPRMLPKAASAFRGLWAAAPVNGLQVALSLLVLCTVWRVQNLNPLLTPLQLPTLSTLAALALAFSSNDPRQRLAGVKHPIVWLAVTILVLAIASIPTSLWPGQSFGFIRDDLIKNFALLVLVAAGIRNINDTRRFVATQAIGASLYAFVTITQFRTDQSGRLAELFYYDANDLAMVLVSTLPLLLYVGVTTRRWQTKLATLVGFGLIMMAVMRAGSRGGFMALAAITIYLVFRFGSVKTSKRVGFVTVLVGAFFITATDATWNQLRTLTSPNDDYNMTAETGRKAVWTRGIGYMMQRPLLGVGVSCFNQAEGRLSALAQERAAEGRGVKWSTAHNSFIEIGAELGFPGLLAFVATLVFAFRTLARIRRRFSDSTDEHARAKGLVDALTASLVGYCVAGFFLSQAYGSYIYLTLGMIVGLNKVTSSLAAGQQGQVGPPRRHPRAGGFPQQMLRPRPAN